VTRLWSALLPELRRFSSTERAAALRQARSTELDMFELVAMAAGLVLVTALTRYSLPEPSIGTRLVFLLVNAAVAIPSLMVVLGPFHLRRLRRGLRKQLQDRQAS
jgi:nitrate/nitrite transporter NarK